jgi:hypothetical protein
MAFTRKKSSTFKWPVTVEFPVDGGGFETESFDAVFKRIGRAEFTKLVDKGDVELLEAVLEGWEGVKDEAGKDIPFTKAALKDMMDDPCFTKGVITAYLASLEGGKAKN